MAYRLTIDPRSSSPIQSAQSSRALVPQAPTSALALPSPLSQVDHSPYLTTPAPQFSEAIISIADLIGHLKKNWKLGIIAALPVAAAVFYLLGMGAKIYEAESKVRVRIGENNVLNLPESGNQGPGELSAPQLVNNHLTEMMSHRFLKHLFENLPQELRTAWTDSVRAHPGRKAQLLGLVGLHKPETGPLDETAFVEAMGSAAHVEPQKESHIIRVIVRDPSPEVTADIANLFAQEYIRFNAMQSSGMTKERRDYFEQQAAHIRTRLEEKERELAEYSKAANITDAVVGGGADGERMKQFNAAIVDAQQRLIKAESDLKTIRITQQAGRDLQEVRLVGEHPDVSYNRKELDAALSKRRALEPMCGRRHPQMQALSGQIENLQAALSRAIDTVVTMAETEVNTQKKLIEDYEAQMKSAQGMAVDQSSKLVGYNILKEQVAAYRLDYQKIASSLRNAEITSGFENASAVVLADTASIPGKPVKPNKPVAALASLMLFSLISLGLPVTWGLVDQHVLKNIRQGGSPSANIPSARDVPHITSPIHLHTQQAPARPATSPFQVAPTPPPLAPLTIPGIGTAPVVARLPRIGPAHPEYMLGQLLKAEPAGAAGALQQITTSLEMQALNRSGLGGVILITSADAGEGKTAAAAALAAAFCHQGRSVFMMECNAVSPALHHWFPHASHHSSWAHDLESLRYGNTHLFLLPAHDLPAYATNELLDGYRTWIDRARHHVDWIILDAGPVLKNFADVAPLAPLATDVLLVNNPSVASPAKLRATLNLLQPMMSSSAFRGLIVQG